MGSEWDQRDSFPHFVNPFIVYNLRLQFWVPVHSTLPVRSEQLRRLDIHEVLPSRDCAPPTTSVQGKRGQWGLVPARVMHFGHRSPRMRSMRIIARTTPATEDPLC